MNLEHLYPKFILQNYLDEVYHGELKAGVLFADISGFTKITESLLSEGKSGVEKLSRIINLVYEPAIETIYSLNGFIAGFAGDAFTAVFPGSAQDVLNASGAIQKIFEKNESGLQKNFNTKLQVKQSVSYGTVKWGIAGEAKKTYYFTGTLLHLTAKLQSLIQPGEILTDAETAKNYVERIKTEPAGKDGFVRIQSIGNLPKVKKRHDLIEYTYGKVLPDFVPVELASLKIHDEFRVIASVFIRYQGPEDLESLNSFLSLLLNLVEEFGGYFSGLDAGDKGIVAPVFFGIPRSHEDDLHRSIRFVSEIIGKYGEEVQAGLTYGPVFTGIIGSHRRSSYTAIGDLVNTSARLMENSQPGFLAVSGQFEKKFGANYATRKIATLTLKGKSDETDLYSLAIKTGTKTETASMVGRREELDTASNYFKQALKKGGGGLWSVFGAPGSGKTMFAHELLAHLEDSVNNFQTVYLPADSILKKSLNPFQFFLNQYFSSTASHDIRRMRENFETRLNNLLDKAMELSKKKAEIPVNHLRLRQSCLGAVIGIFWKNSFYEKLDPQGKADNILTALTDFFRVLSYINPLVVFIEDSHYLDKDSLTMIKRLSGLSESRPLLILLTNRAQTKDEITGRLSNENQEYTFLKPLNEQESKACSEQLIASTISDKLSHFIYKRSGGNPFFIQEFTKFLSNRGYLQSSSDEVTMENFPDDLPETMTSLLTSRVDGFTRSLQKMVKLASVIGNPVRVEVLAKMTNKPEEEVSGIMKSGVEEKVWTDAGENKYIFESDLLRTAAYNMQLDSDLKQAHQRAAEVLDEIYYRVPVYYADIAYHYKKAGDKRAKEAYYRVARFTRDTYKNYKALEFYDELLNLDVSESEKLDIHYEKAGVLETIGEWSTALDLITSGIKRAEELDLTDIKAKYSVKLGEIYQKQSDYQPALEVLSETVHYLAYAELDRDGHKLFGDAYQWLGRTYWSLGKYNESLLSYYKSLVQFGKAEDVHGEALTMYYIGVNYRDKGEHGEALNYYNKSLEIFQELDDKRYITYPLYDIALLYQYKGDLKESRKSFEKVYTIYEEIGYQSGLSAALLNLAKLDEKSGNLEAAKERYTESLSIAREIGEKLAISYTLFSLSVIEYSENNLDKSLEYAKESLTLMVHIKARGYYGYVLSYLSCAYFKMGKYNMALKAALKHIRNIQMTGSDVEHGRTFYSIARTLSEIDLERPGKFEKRYLMAIAKKTGLPNDPETYFKKSIKFSLKAEYMNTLLPVLRHYGIYLEHLGRKDEALKFWKKALSMSIEKGFKAEREKLELLMKQ